MMYIDECTWEELHIDRQAFLDGLVEMHPYVARLVPRNDRKPLATNLGTSITNNLADFATPKEPGKFLWAEYFAANNILNATQTGMTRAVVEGLHAVLLKQVTGVIAEETEAFMT